MSTSDQGPVAESDDGDDLAYVQRVRQAAIRLSGTDRGPDDMRTALMDVEDLARIDIDAPTDAGRRSASLLKTAVKRLCGWYLRYLGSQIAAFGEAVARLGSSLVDRTERLEDAAEDLRTRVADLTERVERLEGGGAPHS